MLEGFVPWPADLAEAYRRAGYWRGVRLGDLPREWAARSGDRVAVVDGERRVTYAELAERVDRLAAALVDLGLAPQDRMVVQLPNVLEFVELTLACFRTGVLPVMALPPHREHEIAYLVDHAEAVAYAIPARLRGFDHQQLARNVRAKSPGLRHVLVVGGDEAVDPAFTDLPAARDDAPAADPAALDRRRLAPSDVALFLLSGGTTGLPKLIPRTSDDYAYNLRRSGEVCGFGPDTVYLVALPVSHNFPLACPGVLGTLDAGGRVVLADSPDPDKAFPLVERERVTVTAVVPAVAIRWLDSPAKAASDLSSLRVLQVGGARVAPETARRIGPELGATCQQVFGMAEGLLNYTRLDDPDEVIVHTQGRPISPADELRIVDASDRPVPEGEPGELQTRGPYTLRGYYRAPEHNARAFTSDGFYRTGDVVRLRPDANLVVEGREKDLINRGGEKISAEEVENLVLAHPGVHQVAAVAMPDAALGERIAVYAVLRAGGSLALPELRAFLEEKRVARFKLPERLEVVEALPLTNVGKVDKKALREDVAARLAGRS